MREHKFLYFFHEGLSNMFSHGFMSFAAIGTTVVVVTHEKDLVDRFGKRVVTIDSGHVVNDSVGGYVGGNIHG